MAGATKTRRTHGPQGRYARASTHRTQGLRRRRQPKQNAISRMLGAVRPGKAAKRAAPTSKTGTAGGLAVLAAAAGVAFKNRDKLKRSGGGNDAGPPSSPAV
jgi:hypothetical protein